MRIDSVEIQGLRNVAHETVELAPVSIFCGPNGSGKTTFIGGVIYALTGRFPGVVGNTVAAIRPLMADPRGAFRVSLRATTSDGLGCTVIRGIARDKHEVVVHVGGSPRTGADAEALLLKHFGDVELAIDMFDPEKSLWRMSAEKRSAWMFELCASASGWSMGRLLNEIGPALPPGGDDWDSKAGRDAASSMELNLARIESRLTAAQRVAREAKLIAEGIASPIFPPTDEEMRRAEADAARASESVAKARKAIEDVTTAQKRIARERAERKRLQAQVTRMEEDLAALPIPTAPLLDHEALEADLLATDIALAECVEATCPTCGGPSRDRLACEAEQRAASERLVEARITQVHYDERVAHLQSSRDAHSKWKAEVERQLAALPPEEPEPEIGAAGEGLQVALDAEAKLRATLTELRRVEGVARERTGQLAAAVAAEARAKALGGLVAKTRAVRTAMLRESVAPLRKALDNLHVFAPPGLRWAVHGDGTFGLAPLDAVAQLGCELITVPAMSSGERYRASIALLLAASMVRKAPWMGLFLDGFEQVSEDARDSVLHALALAVSSHHIDNVFMGGAMEPSVQTLGPILRFFRRPADPTRHRNEDLNP